MRKALYVIGRAMFGGYFIYNGINHLVNHARMSGYAASKGVPGPDVSVTATAMMLLTGGTSVLVGYKPRLGLLMLIGFLIPTSLQMHGFWEVDDPQQKMSEMVNFTKNMALVGAALTMMELGGTWPVSVERATPHERHALGHVSYPQLSERNLRALPA